MKTIGLIGGMSWESTAIYYRLLNEAVRTRLGGLHSAKVLLHSVDFAEIVALQQAGNWRAAEQVLGNAAKGLESAGADCVLICTNTMHLVASGVAAASPAQLIHIIDATAEALQRAGAQRPLLLATRYTMEHGFYADHMRDQHGINVMVPDEAGRALVHSIIFDELCRGIIRPESRTAIQAIVAQAQAQGADCVILGCTEICLLIDVADLPCPIFDSTSLHVEAAVAFALEDASVEQAA